MELEMLIKSWEEQHTTYTHGLVKSRSCYAPITFTTNIRSEESYGETRDNLHPCDVSLKN